MAPFFSGHGVVIILTVSLLLFYDIREHQWVLGYAQLHTTYTSMRSAESRIFRYSRTGVISPWNMHDTITW